MKRMFRLVKNCVCVRKWRIKGYPRDVYVSNGLRLCVRNDHITQRAIEPGVVKGDGEHRHSLAVRVRRLSQRSAKACISNGCG